MLELLMQRAPAGLADDVADVKDSNQFLLLISS
jgi:hypothetical protein